MSFNYSGDRTATQSPASPPADGVSPELVLPSDGDPANVASILQAFKVLADYLAFGRAPFGNVADQTQEVWAAQCARLLKRAGFDHRGFPGGNLLRWQEDWIDVGATAKTSGAGAWFGRWRYSCNAIAGSAGASVTAPTGAVDVAPWLTLSGATGQGAAVVEMCTGQQATSGGGIDYVLEYLLRFDAINGASSFGTGVFDGSLVGLAPTGAFESLNPKGVGLYLPVGGTDLLFYSNVSGTPAAPVDTGIAAAPNTTYRVRLELQAPATSDNAAARLLCYINGSLVADVAPGALPNVALAPAFLAHDNAPSPANMKVGAVRGAYALVPGNLFI